MYNKEISEKMLNDAFDMMNNIRESKNICKDIIGRNSISITLDIIEELDNKTQKDVAEMIDINGGVKGYDTKTYLRLINLYEGIVENNKEVNDIRNKIRERYM